jgi:DNA repair ATPase RecN
MSDAFILSGIEANNKQIERSQRRITELEGKLKLCTDPKTIQFLKEEIEKEKSIIKDCEEANKRLKASLQNSMNTLKQVIETRKKNVEEWKKQGVKFDEKSELEKIKADEENLKKLQNAKAQAEQSIKQTKEKISQFEGRKLENLLIPIAVIGFIIILFMWWVKK